MRAAQETITAVSFNTLVWPGGLEAVSSDICQSVALNIHIPHTFTESLLRVSLCRGGQGRRAAETGPLYGAIDQAADTNSCKAAC